MRIAIASGKGGTGKTTLATNLAAVLSRRGEAVSLLDCDVEEPNCHLFVRPEIEASEPVTVPVPVVDEDKCTGCGTCGEVCQYNAIAVVKGKVLVFPELCHSCGGCAMFCPVDAIRERPREVGVVETGTVGSLHFAQGRLRIGEVMVPRLIGAVKATAEQGRSVVLDAPPGTSCPVIEAVKGADYVLLVTEPTPFGLNDLKLAVEMVRALGLPFGVAINQADVGDDAVSRYCRDEGIDVVLEVPYDRRVAEAYSRGQLAVERFPEFEKYFTPFLERLEERLAVNE